MRTAAEAELSLSVEDFCARTGLRKSWVYQQIKFGRLRALRAGRRVVIEAADARAFIAALPSAAGAAA